MSYSPELYPQLMQHGFSRFAGTFADGQAADNKLELDHRSLSQNQNLLTTVVANICELAEPYHPDFVIGVPNGATNLAVAVAKNMRQEVYSPHLAKDDATKLIDYKTEADRDMIAFLGRGILIEDVLNRRRTTRKVLQLAELGPKICAVIGVFDRSVPAERLPVDKPTHALVHQKIPATIGNKNSRFWRYAL